MFDVINRISRKTLFPFLIITSLVSCSKAKSDISDVLEKNKYLKDSLLVPMDSKSSYDFNYFDVGRIDGNEKLVILNQVNYSIDFYNLQNGNLEKRFEVPQNGPTPVRGTQGMLFHNQDSIFVFTSYLLSKFGLFDGNGEIRSLHRPTNETDNPRDRLLNHSSTPTLPTFYSQGKLFFSKLTMDDPLSNLNFSESHVAEFLYFLNRDSVVQLQQLKMPSDYLGRTMPLSFSFHSKALNDSKEFVISWFASDSIYVYDMNFNLKSAILGKSGLSKGFEKTTHPLSEEESNRLTISQTHYPRLIYDPYRRLYYRFAHIARAYDPNELIDHKSIQKNPFSVIVLDEDFNIIKEVIFPGSTYNLYKAFVAEEGLYLPKTNIFYINLNEDEVTYEIFDFSSL